MGKTLLQKVWELHTVRTLPTGQTQLFIGLHLIHEVTTPQAFDALRARGWKVARPDRTFATTDHIVPTRERTRPFLAACYAGTLALLALTGWLAGLSAAYYAALALPAALLARQVATLDIHDPAHCLWLFKANREVGLAVALALLIGRA